MSDQWPLFEFCASLLNEKTSRLHISFDLLIGDGRSFEIVFQELMQLYHHPGRRACRPSVFVQGLSPGSHVSRTDRCISRVARVLDESCPGPSAVPGVAAGEEHRFHRAAPHTLPLRAPGLRSLEEPEGKVARFNSTPVGTLLAAYVS